MVLKKTSNYIVDDTIGKILDYLIKVIAVSMVIFTLICTQKVLITPMQMVVLHGGLVLILVYLRNLKNNSFPI